MSLNIAQLKLQLSLIFKLILIVELNMQSGTKFIIIFSIISIILINLPSRLYSFKSDDKSSHKINRQLVLHNYYKSNLANKDIKQKEINLFSCSIGVYKDLRKELQSLLEAEKNGNLEDICKYLNNITHQYLSIDNYKLCLEYNNKLKKYGMFHKNNNMLFHYYFNLSLINTSQYKDPSALVNLLKALKYTQGKTGFLSKKAAAHKFRIYQMISFIYSSLDNFKESLFYAKAAVLMAEKFKNPKLIFLSKYTLSIAYSTTGFDKKTIEILPTAFSELKSPNKWQRYIYYLSMGTAYYNLKEYDKALIFLNKCRGVYLHNRYMIYIPTVCIGRIYVKKGMLLKAYNYLKYAENLKINPTDINYDNLINMGFFELFYAEKKYKKAIKYILIYKKIEIKHYKSLLAASVEVQKNKFINTKIPILKDDILSKKRKLHTAETYNLDLIIISILILIMLFLFFHLYYNKKKYAKQLNHLNNSLDDKVKERTKELRKSFSKIRKEIETRKKIESEIRIAGEIQQSILPNITAKYKRPEFALYAELEPAKDAAGDFYDFFYIDENTLALIIADVSGKGITAAFFMAFAKTILRNICPLEKNPSDALDKTNKILATDNDKCMFVTAFLCYYNIKTGNIAFANSGHHNSIIISDNSQTLFGHLNNVPLGIMENVTYQSGNQKLSVGDSIIFYTDGVTEAISPSEEEYGEKRLYNLLQKHSSLEPSELTQKIIREVTGFEEGSRFDDITILIFRRNE